MICLFISLHRQYMRWELIVSQGHLSQILDAKNAPTGRFRTKTMLRNVHRATDVSVDTMR